MSTRVSYGARHAGESPPPATVSRDLVAFGVLTFALSWIPWFALAALRMDVGAGAGFVVFGLAAAAPSVSALILRIAGRRRPATARTRPSYVWPIVALGAAAAPPLGAAVCTHLGDLAILPAHAAATVAGVGGPLVAFAYTMISGPLSEEFGWRGFAQPRLRIRLGRFRTALVLGLCWGVWHLPLFFLDGTGQHAMGMASVSGILFFVGLVPLSYTFLFVSERLGGGVWAAVIAHAAWNLTSALMPTPTPTAALIETATMTLIALACAVVCRHPHEHENVRSS